MAGLLDRRRGRAIVVALSVTVTVSYGVLAYALPVLFVPMHAELGFSRTELTVAASVSLAAAAVAGVAVGRLLDRLDPRLVMTAGSVLATLAVLGWSRVQSLAALYAVFAVLGVAMAAVTYGPAFTVVAKWIAVRRTAALTVLTVAGAFASLIFSPLTEALSSALGWRDAVVVLAIVLGAVTIPLHLLVLRPPPRRPPRQGEPSVPARRALRSRGFWLLATAFALGAFAWSALTVNLVLILVALGHPVAFAALAAGVTGISQLPGRLLYGPVRRWLGERGTLPFALGLGALALLVLVTDQSRAAALAFAVLFGTGAGMQTLLTASAPASMFGVASYGSVAGVLHACINGARAAGPFALAAFAALAGGYLTAAAVVAAALLAMAAVTIVISTAPPSSSSVPSGT
ncbi:MAG: MFS transporter [Solirubrobacteraceae bacterium]